MKLRVTTSEKQVQVYELRYKETLKRMPGIRVYSIQDIPFAKWLKWSPYPLYDPKVIKSTTDHILISDVISKGEHDRPSVCSAIVGSPLHCELLQPSCVCSFRHHVVHDFGSVVTIVKEASFPYAHGKIMTRFSPGFVRVRSECDDNEFYIGGSVTFQYREGFVVPHQVEFCDGG